MPDPASNWIPLISLQPRFAANVAALATRNGPLSQQLAQFNPVRVYAVQSLGNDLRIGSVRDGQIEILPQSVTIAAVRDMLAKLQASRVADKSLLIVGEELGFLWHGLYQFPCGVSWSPCYRPPLFFLVRESERLWIMLHLHDWQKMLADPRVKIFAGSDAVAQFAKSLSLDSLCPWPKLCVSVDNSLWPAGTNLDSILHHAETTAAAEVTQTQRRMRQRFGAGWADQLAEKIQSNQPLRVMGITTRHTTFLQYSMRDWLAAFDRLGHHTHLVIENHDHEVVTRPTIARACDEFEPDLVVMLDHYRAELNVIPTEIPMVMWVQDWLENLASPAAGAAHTARDFVMGYFRAQFVREFGYPSDRFMHAVVGVNERRFQPQKLSPSQERDFACDVSFVSHASTPADVLVDTEIRQAPSPRIKQIIRDVFDQLRTVYASGQTVSNSTAVGRFVDRAADGAGDELSTANRQQLLNLFTHQVNNALFRHQALQWAADMDIDLRLYGRGWEKHPTLSRFARGVADNESHLRVIYQASRINLQLSPHGAFHQRVMEGLACGAFFMLRHCPHDVVKREIDSLCRWCVDNQIRSEEEFATRASADIIQRTKAVAELMNFSFDDTPFYRITFMSSGGEAGFLNSTGFVWGDDYDAVSFKNETDFRGKVGMYLADGELRRQLTTSMLQPILEKFTYVANTECLLAMIRNNLAKAASSKQLTAVRPAA